jgi:hypothetical protein
VQAVGPLTLVCRTLAALLFLAFVIGQAPHTVHHLFEPDHAEAECPFATAGDRLPGLDAASLELDERPAWTSNEHLPAPPRLPGAVPSSSLARAPPRAASALA